MKNIVEVNNPILVRDLLVLSGYTFLSENEKEFAIYQIFRVFGSKADNPDAVATWHAFVVDQNGKLEELTSGNDILYIPKWFEESGKAKGLNDSEIETVLRQASEKVLSNWGARRFVERNFKPYVMGKELIIKDYIQRLEELNESELVLLMQIINDLLPLIKEFYPRSYEKLLGIKLKVKTRYFKLKYPELYLEIEKVRNDEEYMSDKNDDIVGIGYRSIFEGIFAIRFISSVSFDHRELNSPFEPLFSEPLFFNN